MATDRKPGARSTTFEKRAPAAARRRPPRISLFGKVFGLGLPIGADGLNRRPRKGLAADAFGVSPNGAPPPPFNFFLIEKCSAG